MKSWPVLGIVIVQSILCLAHWFIFYTFTVFEGNLSPAATLVLRTTFVVLAFSFTLAALLGFSFFNPLVRLIYKIAVVWLGFLNFFFWASCLSWIVWFAVLIATLAPHPAHSRALIVDTLFTAALLAGIYGLVNALYIRVRRITVPLANLPEPWRGRTALVVSDLHLGHVNGAGFCRRVVTLATRLDPDIVFIPGDVFDGTKADAVRMAAPFKELSVPFGVYFSTGNHEEYGDEAGFLHALRGAGVRVLTNEKVIVDGLQIVGVPYRESTYPMRLRATLDGLRIDPAAASILLSHAPNRLPIAKQAGFGLQVSGHTHGGQVFPFTWLTRLVFGEFTWGLHRFSGLRVYTSCGAGTWGPPMRVGTHPEIVLLRFEQGSSER